MREWVVSGARVRARVRLPADRVLVAQIGLAVLVVGGLFTGPGTPLAVGRVSWSASIVFNVFAAVAARRVVRLLPPGDPARRFWRAYGITALLIVSGYLVQLAITARGPVPPELLLGGPVTTALVGVGALGVVVVMCTYPLRISSRRARTCFWLDMSTVMVGAAAFGWFFCSGPGGDGGLGAVLLAVLTGPVVMLVAVFAVAKLLIAGQPPFTLAAGLVGVGAPAVNGVTVALGPAMLAHGHAPWYFAVSAAGDACLMLAARVQRWQVGQDPGALRRTARRPYSTLPYLALAASFTLLIVALFGHGLDGRTWAVLGGVVASTALIVVRQLASFSDNARLLAELRVALHERDVLANELHDMAFRDGLTGLANRALFHDRLATALARVRRGHGELAVMLVDLDDFKPVNDRYGHAAGDTVLCEVGRRLRECVRETDTVARLGGDEYAVLLDSPNPDWLPHVSDRIVTAVGRPCLVDGVPVRVGASVGVVYDDTGLRNVDELLRAADVAMYRAKSLGKGAAVRS